MNEKKTILYVGGFELPDKNAAAQRVLANAKIFRELGFNVVLIGVDKTLVSNFNFKDTKVQVEGFDTYSVSYPRSTKEWLKHIVSSKYIEDIIKENYVENLYGMICYNYSAIALYRIKKLCDKNNILFIPDATEWYESSGGSFVFNIVKCLDTTLRMKVIQPQAKGLISVSNYLSEFYEDRGCNVVTLPTLYDVEKLVDRKEKMEDLNIVRLLYAGSAFNIERIDKYRNNIKDRIDKIIIMLFNVYQEQQNFRLDIYGLTKENYLTVFSEHKKILDELSEVIIFYGRKPHNEIIENIQNSDFTIFMRNIDRVIEAGFPSKFSESISYGTPVISNMISNIKPYTVEGKNSFIIDLKDEKKQLEKMLTILNLTYEERKSMQDYCLKNKIFDFRKYVNRVGDFIQKLEKS